MAAHYLTIENQEFSRKKLIEDALESARRQLAERDREIIILQNLSGNLESRIYAQFAKQLVESMFANDNPVGFGSFILEGNTITWEVITDESGAEFIRLTIVAEDGTSETVVEIPVGTGNFGQDPDTGGGGDGGGFLLALTLLIIVGLCISSLNILINHRTVILRHGVKV